MPGVLPLKTIQLNSSSQSRIAQACDRCRSKKIRCDGIQPNCTPCQAVNFECKTSDKLSRKAYPKGYTSSLEERVRELEAEVRDLKNLLDEKDEKIDILSKMRRPSVAPPVPTPPASTPSDHGKDDSFKIQQPPGIYGKSHGSATSYFVGASSGRPFVDAFKAKLHEDRKRAVPFESADLFRPNDLPPKNDSAPRVPPHILSDQLINIFFQEWAPMFPVLHRPTFLKIYQDYLANPHLKNPHSHAQMYLVFGIATLASPGSKDLVHAFEAHWRKALGEVLFEPSVDTLQCLILAQLYCITKGDYKRLVHYRGLAVSMSSLLGLHQSQQPLPFGALTRETRKRVFWCLYTIECFAAASLGLPRLIKDSDIQTEEPCDVDDENVSERGFQATLPGESTKISSALALFKAAKVLSKILDEVYPNTPTYELSLSKITYLSEELDNWRDALPPHLRLEFIQDKFNVNVTGDRSPLLALVYFHIRSCLHRQVVAANIGEKGMPFLMTLAESSKRIGQLAELLVTRGNSFSLCVNRSEMLALAGIGLLSQAVELKTDSKLCRDSGKLVISIAELVVRNSKATSITLKKVAIALFGKDAIAVPPHHFSSPEGSMSPPKIPERKTSPKDQIQATTSRFSFSGARQSKKASLPTRRSTVTVPQMQSNLAVYSRSSSQARPGSSRTTSAEPHRRGSTESSQSASFVSPATNLDYLPIESEAADLGSDPSQPCLKAHGQGLNTEWDPLLAPYQTFDASTTPTMTVGGPDYLNLVNYQGMSTPPLSAPPEWSPDAWNLFDHSNGNGVAPPQSATTQSVFSLSDESLASGEDLSSCDFAADAFPGYAIPAEEGFAPGFDELATA